MKFEYCFIGFSKPGKQRIACQWDSNLWGQGHGCFRRAAADSDLHLRSNVGICCMRHVGHLSWNKGKTLWELSRTQLLHFVHSTYFYKSIQILHDSSLSNGTGASWIQETHLKRFKCLRTGCQSLVSLLLLEALLMRLSAIRSLSFAKKTGERGKNRGMDILRCKFPYPISSMYRLVPVQALNAKRRYEE